MKSLNDYPWVRQLTVLFRHSLNRLFFNDLLKFENQQRENQAVILSLCAIGGGFIAHEVLKPFLMFALFGLTAADLWREEALLITFNMALTGVIGVATWDKLFLDRLDHINLRPLPVKNSIIFSAKFFSLLSFIILITTVTNLFSSLVFGSYPADLLAANPIIGGVAHFTANILSGLFIFFAVALIQRLIMIFFTPGFGKRLAVFVQMLLLFVSLSPFVWFPMIYPSLSTLKANASAIFTYYPPLWFTGIYNRIIGVKDPILDRYAGLGWLAPLLMIALYLVLTPLSLRAYLKGDYTSAIKPKYFPIFAPFKRWFISLFLRHPQELGVFSFFLRTARRSREYKLKLTLFMAIPISFLLSNFAFLYFKKGFITKAALDSYLISIPLALHFFLILGTRIAITYPHTLSANWIFRLCETKQITYYIGGFKKALFFTAVLPPLLVAYPLFHFFWNAGPALLHTLYSMSVALLLVEICFFNFHKLPFAAEHTPGKLKLRYSWPLLLVGYIQYYLTFSRLGLILMKNPYRYPLFFLVALIVLMSLRIYQNRRLKNGQLVFEEEPEPAMLSLGLD